jgi:DNA-binding NtrC family response regulator
VPDRKVVIVDDEADVRLPLRRFLLGKGYAVLEADSVASVRAVLGQESVDAAVVDFSLPDGDGLDVLRSVKAQDASVPVVLLTGHGSIDLAVKAIKEGAEQFFTKPVELPALLVVIERALENRRMRQVSLAGKSVQARQTVDPFFGESAVIRKLAADAARIVASTVPVLICGETGTGKGVLARWLHQNGPRAEEAFVDLNCAGLSRDLLETELFGHEKGRVHGGGGGQAGPAGDRPSRDDVPRRDRDVDLQVQAKLLKVVEDLRYRRLGDVRDRQVDVRLLAATHRDLGRLVQEQKFREDLYYRLNTIPLVVPPLRERASDVILLARRLVERISVRDGTARRAALRRRRAGAALTRLAGQRAPAPQRARAGPAPQRPLDARARGRHRRAGVRHAALRRGERELRHPGEAERRHIEAVLREERGAVASAAEVLGLSRSALYERIKKHGIVTTKGTES